MFASIFLKLPPPAKSTTRSGEKLSAKAGPEMIESAYVWVTGVLAFAMLGGAIWEGDRRRAFVLPGYRSSLVAIALIMVGSAAALALS